MINKTTSNQVLILADALKNKGLFVETEKFDGYKHIDIVIPKARLNIEVDGLQHFVDSKQIISDLNRSFYSNKHGFNTIHISNVLINMYCDEIASALKEVVVYRIEKFNKPKNFFNWIIYYIKKLLKLID